MKTKTKYIGVQVPLTIYAQIRKAANDDGRSLSSYLRVVLESALAKVEKK